MLGRLSPVPPRVWGRLCPSVRQAWREPCPGGQTQGAAGSSRRRGARAPRGWRCAATKATWPRAPFWRSCRQECRSLDLGVVVCNAAQAPIGDFVTRDVDDLARVVDVNVRAPLLLLRGLLPEMVARRTGGRHTHDLYDRSPGHASHSRLRCQQGVSARAGRRPVVRAQGQGHRRDRLQLRSGAHSWVRHWRRAERPRAL